MEEIIYTETRPGYWEPAKRWRAPWLFRLNNDERKKAFLNIYVWVVVGLLGLMELILINLSICSCDLPFFQLYPAENRIDRNVYRSCLSTYSTAGVKTVLAI